SAPKPRVFSTLTLEAKRGMTIVAAIPIRSAWDAPACAWLPAETASTPLARSAGVSCVILLSAPRSLNDAVNCRFSNVSDTSQPQICDSVRDARHGESTISPRSRSAAARTSSIDGAAVATFFTIPFSRARRAPPVWAELVKDAARHSTIEQRPPNTHVNDVVHGAL